VQSEKILAITNAAGVELEPIWASLLAKALEGKNVKDLLSSVGSGGGAPVGGPAVPAAGGAPTAVATEEKEEKKEEKEEESDDDMVCLSLLLSLAVVHVLYVRVSVFLIKKSPCISFLYCNRCIVKKISKGTCIFCYPSPAMSMIKQRICV